MYDKASPGLAVHLRTMHYDLDPSSKDFNMKFQYRQDEIDDEGRYQVGAQRTPSGKQARRAFLWRPFASVIWTPDSRVSTDELYYALCKDQIARTEELMLPIGEFFLQALHYHAKRSTDDNDTYNGDIYSFDLWTYATTVYFQLASRIPYLRQLGALAVSATTALAADNAGSREHEDVLLRAIDHMGYQMVNQPECSLGNAMTLGKLYKKQGDDAMRANSPSLAVAMYIRAILAILPWFPSEYYMAPWESRMVGVAGLVVACNINLGIALRDGFQASHTAFLVLQRVLSLSCLTNKDKAKIFHHQAICAINLEIEEQTTRADISGRNKRIPDLPTSIALFSARNAYLAKPPNELAATPWVGDFSPARFREHYLDLRTRLHSDPDREYKDWYKAGNSMPNVLARVWLKHMTEELARLEAAEGAGGGEEEVDELAAENAKFEKMECDLAQIHRSLTEIAAVTLPQQCQ